jgi:hypothetical protein
MASLVGKEVDMANNGNRKRDPEKSDKTNESDNTDRKDAGGGTDTDSWRKNGYEEERPGYDIDVETEVPSGKEAAEQDQPGSFDSRRGDVPAGGARRPEMDPTHPRGAPETRDLPLPKPRR